MKVILSRGEQAALTAHPDSVVPVTKEIWVPGYGNTKETVDHIGADYTHERKVYIEGYNQGEQDTIKRAANWIKEHITRYLNGEYNEFHHDYEYDGTVDKTKLIEDFVKDISYDEGSMGS